MNKFVALIDSLEGSSDRLECSALLLGYLRQVEDAEGLRAVALLSGRRPRRVMTQKLLRSCLLEETEIPLWLHDASARAVGDKLETLSLLLGCASNTVDRSLCELIDVLEQIRNTEEGKQAAFVLACLREMDFGVRRIFCKLLTGGFRLSPGQFVISHAISIFLQVDRASVCYLLENDWNIKSGFAAEFAKDNRIAATCRPYPFMSGGEVDFDLEELGPASDWLLEWKWRGLRVQAVYREGQAHIWTLSGDLIASKFPELIGAFSNLPDGTVLDGVLIAWKDGKAGAAAELASRLSKSKPSKKFLSDLPVRFVAVDILENEGKDIRKLPLTARRDQLVQLLEQFRDSLLVLGQYKAIRTWAEVESLAETAKQYGCSGLVFKRLDGQYGETQSEHDWYKWQLPMRSTRAVLLYVQGSAGPGLRTPLEMTFALRDGEELIPIVKLSEGLTEEEYEQIIAYAKKNTIDKFGPVRSIKPELVFELSFATVLPSKRRKSGLMLRKAQINRWLKDDAAEVDDLRSLRDLLIP